MLDRSIADQHRSHHVMAIAPIAAVPADDYPVSLTVTDERDINRLWGIPFLGVAARAFMAIPHFAVLSIMGFGIYVWAFLGWIPILAYGRVPGLAVKFLIEYLHRGTRTAGYVAFLMPGGYPPLEPGMGIPVDLEVRLDSLEINRWWGIPFVGMAVRVLILLPQIVILSFLIVGVVLTWLVLWIPILASGRYPDWAARFYGMCFRYGVRMAAYQMFLPVPYPPIWPS
jgi:hypothetical protein